MKRISLLLLASLLLCATAYAAKPAISLMINGALVKSPVAPQIIKGTTMVPLRIISEALGATVDWNAAKQQVTVTMPTTGVQKPTGLSLAQLNKIGQSVGLVYQMDAQGNQIGTGSAFVVNGIAVTNYHVADGNADSLVIDFGSTVQTVKVADAVFSNAEADLIGFRVSGVTGLKLSTVEPKKGELVYSLGYPNRKFQISEGELLFFSVDGNITHDADIDRGSSGGVLLNASGQVIGVTNGGIDGSIYDGAIPVKVLQAELIK